MYANPSRPPPPTHSPPFCLGQVLPSLSSLLVRCSSPHPGSSLGGGGAGGGLDALGAALLKAYQQYIYAAGVWKVGKVWTEGWGSWEGGGEGLWDGCTL